MKIEEQYTTTNEKDKIQVNQDTFAIIKSLNAIKEAIVKLNLR